MIWYLFLYYHQKILLFLLHLYNYRIPRDIGPPKIGCEAKKLRGGPIFLGISNLSL